MRVKKIILKHFKRFDDLTINLGDSPKKIIALVGPNGCGKSSIFDAFEEKMKDFRHLTREGAEYFSKAMYQEGYDDAKKYVRNNSITISFVDNKAINRITFYIRSAYRFTSKLNVTQINKQEEILKTDDEPTTTIAIDKRLENNYRRLLGFAYAEFDAGEKTGAQVRSELMEKINGVLRSILDIEVSSLGNVSKGMGQMYFKKENTLNFPYANLSSGEKEVVDIVVDLIVKTQVYTDTIFCIDEPELHINTSIQRKLLIELDKLIPENCQLWIATHSIGFLRALQGDLADKAQILDFSQEDYFNGAKTIEPIKPTRKNWQRIFGTALEDLTGLISPKKIIYCEGKVSTTDKEEKGLDAQVYNEIFSIAYPDCLFVSSGGNTELDQRAEIAMAILGKVLSEIDIWILKDRDFDSGKPTDETRRQQYLKANTEALRVLRRWEIENYLYDKEILKKYCVANDLQFNEGKYDSFVTDIINQNLKDEIGIIKACCGMSYSVSAEKFKLDLARFIISATSVFAELEQCIFERK